MARKRPPDPDPTPAPTATTPETVASLRLRGRGSSDWAFDAEGFLLLYDPTVIGDEVFDGLFGLQTVAAAALGWMTGHGGTASPIVAEPQHWRAHGRAETAARVARLVRLGWECSLAMFPFRVASNGADVRFRSGALTPDEKKAHLDHHRQRARGPISEPRRTWLALREDRLAVTWDFMLGFESAQRRELFQDGHTAEIEWPAGAYQVSGWTFPTLETDDGAWIDQYVLRLEPWTTGREPD